MQRRPQIPATLKSSVKQSIKDALLFWHGNPGKNIGATGRQAAATTPIRSHEGVTVNSSSSAWRYPGGYSAIPITVIIDFRALGSPASTNHALWASRASPGSGDSALYFRYNPSGSLQLLRSQVAQIASVAYSLPTRGGIVAFSYDGNSYRIAADGKILAAGTLATGCTFDTPSIGIEGGTSSPGFDVANAVFRGVFTHSRILTDADLIAATANPYIYVAAPEMVLAASATAGVDGTLSVNESSETLAATGGVLISGTLDRMEGADTFAASGTVTLATITGTTSVSEVVDTLSASGSTGFATITGTLARSEGIDTLVAAGAIGNAITGSLTVSEGIDIGLAAGTVTNAVITASLAASEGSDSLSASGALVFVPITGSLARSEAPDTLMALGGYAAVTGTVYYRYMRQSKTKIVHYEQE